MMSGEDGARSLRLRDPAAEEAADEHRLELGGRPSRGCHEVAQRLAERHLVHAGAAHAPRERDECGAGLLGRAETPEPLRAEAR